MSMYKSKYNHYVSQLIEITDTEAVLVNSQNVTDRVKLENFEANWELSHDINDYTKLISDTFLEVLPKCHIHNGTNSTVVYIDDDYIKFNIIEDKIRTEFSKTLSDRFEFNSVMFFNLDDAYDIFNTIAGLFID